MFKSDVNGVFWSGILIHEEFYETPEEEPKVHYDVFYRCLRCGTHASNTELDKLPEIKCICGFRVFTKIRPEMAKTVNAI